jgi:hypothetical protein
LKVGHQSNIKTGCTILDNGNLLFSEYNYTAWTDRVTLNDSDDNYIRTVQKLDNTYVSSFDITSIDTNTIAISTGKCISIDNIDKHELLHKIKNGRVCYGITHCDGKLQYFSGTEVIRRFDLKTKFNELLVPTTNIREFSNISCDGNKLLYVSSTETVSYCDMNGKQIWRFKDTSILCSFCRR